MDEGVFTNLLLLIVGTLAGVLGTLAKSAWDRRVERKAELDQQQSKLRQQYLDPLRLSARELSEKLKHVLEEFQKQRHAPRGSYRLHDWFLRCKEYIVNDSQQWTDEQRLRELAMHSGGEGYDAVSTLYLTAQYLYYATAIRRFRTSDIPLAQSDERLNLLIEQVRDRFSEIGFYKETQDRVGDAMGSPSGGAVGYGVFCELLTDKDTRPWFLTLADTFLKLDTQPSEKVRPIIEGLEKLAGSSR